MAPNTELSLPLPFGPTRQVGTELNTQVVMVDAASELVVTEAAFVSVIVNAAYTAIIATEANVVRGVLDSDVLVKAVCNIVSEVENLAW